MSNADVQERMSTLLAGTGGAGTGGAPPPQAVPPQAALAEAAVPAAAALVMEQSGTPVRVSASTAAPPVGSWVKVLAWSLEGNSEYATLGLYNSDWTRLVAVFKMQVVRHDIYPTIPPLIQAGTRVVPTAPLCGGGCGPMEAAVPLQGQGSAARFGGGPAEVATGPGDTDSDITELAPDEPVPGETDISPAGWT